MKARNSTWSRCQTSGQPDDARINFSFSTLTKTFDDSLTETFSDQLDDAAAWRVSAHDLERLVCERLSQHLGDHQMLCDLAPVAPAVIIQALLAQADLAAATLRGGGRAGERARLLAAIITRVDFREDAKI